MNKTANTSINPTQNSVGWFFRRLVACAGYFFVRHMDWHRLRLTEELIVAATDAYARGGTEGLSVEHRRALVKMIFDDYRCAAALPESPTPGDQPIPALVETFRVTWCAEPLMRVPDLRIRLLEGAKACGDADIPVARLVLLATWIEHTINDLMVRGA